MKDCILSLFWPRKDIVGFFEKHGCTKAEISNLQLEGENALKRHEVVDALFNALAARSDSGLGPLRAMLQSLLNWSQFDPYYFDKLRKLDRSAAHRNLEHLRQLQEIRDAKIKADRERRAAQEAVHQQPTASLEQLRAEYLDLLANKTSRQQRGYALERILAELSRLSHLETTEAFRVVGEQVSYFSINAGMLGNERHAPMVQAIPLDRMLTETDGPFTRTGDRPSQPTDVASVVEALGHLHHLPAADVASHVRDNLRALVEKE